MHDIRQTREYASYLRQVGWIVETINGVNYFIRKFPLIGSAIKVQRPEKLDLAVINRLAEKYRAFQIIIEPLDQEQIRQCTKSGFKLSPSPYLPTATIHLDLSLPMNRLIGSMKKDARYILRKTRPLMLTEATGVANFRNAWQKAVGWKRYIPPYKNLQTLKKAFGKKSLFLTTNGSGAMFLIGDKTAYYWQAFTDLAGRRAGAQYRIVWEGVQWARAAGAKVFDFEGIYDERFPNKAWRGFTHFKKSFGGKEVRYPGAYIKNRWPL